MLIFDREHLQYTLLGLHTNRSLKKQLLRKFQKKSHREGSFLVNLQYAPSQPATLKDIFIHCILLMEGNMQGNLTCLSQTLAALQLFLSLLIPDKLKVTGKIAKLFLLQQAQAKYLHPINLNFVNNCQYSIHCNSHSDGLMK